MTASCVILCKDSHVRSSVLLRRGGERERERESQRKEKGREMGVRRRKEEVQAGGREGDGRLERVVEGESAWKKREKKGRGRWRRDRGKSKRETGRD